MKYGVMENVLGLDRSQEFAAAARLGFDGVEIDWGRPEDAEPGGPLGPERRSQIRIVAQDARLEIPSVCAHFMNGGGLAHADPDTQQAGVAAALAGIALAGDLGARALLLPFFGAGEVADTPEAHDRLVRHLKTLALPAEERGITLAVESTMPAFEVARLVDAVGSTAVRCYWDMANAMALGYDPIEEVELLGWRIAQVHAKEFAPSNDHAGSRSAPRFSELNKQPLGQGRVPVAAVLSTLSRLGYNGYVVLETGAFGDRLESAEAALKHLKASAPGG